jgi:hypothetical protein
MAQMTIHIVWANGELFFLFLLYQYVFLLPHTIYKGCDDEGCDEGCDDSGMTWPKQRYIVPIILICFLLLHAMDERCDNDGCDDSGMTQPK